MIELDKFRKAVFALPFPSRNFLKFIVEYSNSEKVSVPGCTHQLAQHGTETAVADCRRICEVPDTCDRRNMLCVPWHVQRYHSYGGRHC